MCIRDRYEIRREGGTRATSGGERRKARSSVKGISPLVCRPADDAICEGISPLGYLQKVNQSPTQTKPYHTLPPFEPRDSWSSYGAVRAYSEVLL